MNLDLKEENKLKAHYFEEVNPVELETFTIEMAKDVKAIWADPAIQDAYQRRNEFQLMDGAQYCFEHVERFAAADYIPDETDVLRVRARTTGIIETTFKVRGTHLEWWMLEVRRVNEKNGFISLKTLLQLFIVLH